jgi:hypothetical protein
VDTLGPHAIDLITQVRDADRKWSHTHGEHVFTSTLPEKEITQLLADYERRGEPLPLAPSTPSATGRPPGGHRRTR